MADPELVVGQIPLKVAIPVGNLETKLGNNTEKPNKLTGTNHVLRGIQERNQGVIIILVINIFKLYRFVTLRLKLILYFLCRLYF